MGFDLGDLTDVEPSTGGGSYTILPKGIYRLGINDVGDEQTTAEGNSTAYIEYAVTEGEHEGETFRIFYNRKNSNAQAVEIAQRELSALGHAVGVFGGNAEALIGKTFMAKVGIRPPSVNKRTGKEYGESNSIDKYYRQDENPAAAAPTPRPAPVAVASRPAAVAAAPGARPWAKRA